MKRYLAEVRYLFLLAVPVIIAQFSQTAMGVVDTIMAGGVSATDMAAVAVGTSIWLPTILFGHGLLLALTPVVAQLNGAGRRREIAGQICQGYWLAASVSLLIMLVLYHCQIIINSMHNIDPLLAEKAIGYLHALLWGAPGYLFFQVCRNQCEGLSKTKPGMVIGFLGLLVNIPINYIFIHGKLGAPALGGVGCGVATASVYWLMFALMRYYTHKASHLHDIRQQLHFTWPDFTVLKKLANLGLPVALAMFFEVTLFAVVALLVSPLGAVEVAGHQIALNFSSLMFVFPLSLGVAATIRVGFRIGEGSTEQAAIAAWSCLMLGALIASLTALFTATFRQSIALLYNDQAEVVTMASHLMLFAAFYQISDSLQVIGNGILRGYKDTKAIFLITFISYWLLGLPIGYLLALTSYLVPAMGPSGFWIGFIIGLTASAIMMITRIYYLQQQPMQHILSRARR